MQKITASLLVYHLLSSSAVFYNECIVKLCTEKHSKRWNSGATRPRCLNYLGYYLTWNGQTAEALTYLEQSIELGEQGYCNFGVLAAAYGDKSQALMELGRFEEALLFDEKALAEVQRCAESGDALSQDEVWIYLVNRGRLYLRLGRIEEAEALLQEAEPRIQPHRSIYRLLARRALAELKQQHSQPSPQQEADR